MNPDDAHIASATAIAEQMQHQAGALMPILHAIQDQMGYIPAQVLPAVAKVLNLSRAEVHGVVSFYPLFRSSPPGSTVVGICRAESCQAMGSAILEEHIKATLGIDYNQTTADGKFSLEPIYCLGNCACSPNITLDEKILSRATNASFDRWYRAQSGIAGESS